MRSWLKWAGHVERLKGVQLTKRADALGVEGRRRRGRPRLRWEDCVKRKWRMGVKDRGEWRQLEMTVKWDQ